MCLTGTPLAVVHLFSLLLAPDLSNNPVSWQNIRIKVHEQCIRVFLHSSRMLSVAKDVWDMGEGTHWRRFDSKLDFFTSGCGSCDRRGRSHVYNRNRVPGPACAKQGFFFDLRPATTTTTTEQEEHHMWIHSHSAKLIIIRNCYSVCCSSQPKLFGIFNPKHLTYSTLDYRMGM